MLLYTSNGKPGNEFEYLAVELVGGKIVYHFNSGPGVVHVQTDTDYATGEWVKVSLFFGRFEEFSENIVGLFPEKKLYPSCRGYRFFLFYFVFLPLLDFQSMLP